MSSLISVRVLNISVNMNLYVYNIYAGEMGGVGIGGNDKVL